MGVQFFHPFLFHRRLDAKRGGGPVEWCYNFHTLYRFKVMFADRRSSRCRSQRRFVGDFLVGSPDAHHFVHGILDTTQFENISVTTFGAPNGIASFNNRRDMK